MRCAIYTRKSADEGLDAAFTTLDNQREYCSAYIASQGGAGWAELPQHYDDGGWSGGNLKRPALTQLRADIANGLIDIVVVYKIDRLSRSLRDFANLVAEFEARKVTFVSVTQAFDTGTAMGRLTLNVLLSFAQFERELTSERLKDWFSGARKRGLWPHQRPFGYMVVEGRLQPDPAEAKIIGRIYRLYGRLGSARLVANTLNAGGLLNKAGRPWSQRTVTAILSNRLYCGYHPNETIGWQRTHDAIVSDRQWQRMQALIARQGRRKCAERKPPRDAMLKRILFAASGHAMVHVPVKGRNGQQYRYYVSTQANRYGSGSTPHGRFRAEDLELPILALVEGLTATPNLYGHLASRIPSETGAASKARVEAEIFGTVRRLIKRIEIRPDSLVVKLIGDGEVMLPPVPSIPPTRRTRVEGER